MTDAQWTTEPPTDAEPLIGIAEAEAASLEVAKAPQGPRTRWAAIVWGLVLGGIAVAALWTVASPERRDGFADWVLMLSPAAIAAYAFLVVGGFALVTGVVGLARRLQRARA